MKIQQEIKAKLMERAIKEFAGYDREDLIEIIVDLRIREMIKE